MVLGKLPLPGRPTNLDNSRARVDFARNRCGWGGVRVVWTSFPSSVIFLFFLPLSGRHSDID